MKVRYDTFLYHHNTHHESNQEILTNFMRYDMVHVLCGYLVKTVKIGLIFSELVICKKGETFVIGWQCGSRERHFYRKYLSIFQNIEIDRYPEKMKFQTLANPHQ